MTPLEDEQKNSVARWKVMKKEAENAEQAYLRAQTELLNATIALGRWLTPKNARIGETFSIWVDDELITVEATAADLSDFRVSLRSKEW